VVAVTNKERAAAKLAEQLAVQAPVLRDALLEGRTFTNGMRYTLLDILDWLGLARFEQLGLPRSRGLSSQGACFIRAYIPRTIVLQPNVYSEPPLYLGRRSPMLGVDSHVAMYAGCVFCRFLLLPLAGQRLRLKWSDYNVRVIRAHTQACALDWHAHGRPLSFGIAMPKSITGNDLLQVTA
jgi:hypothetical protein